MFELTTRDSKTAAERGIVVPLEDPATGQPIVTTEGEGDDAKSIPLTITILGGDAGKVRARGKKTLDEHFEAFRKNRQVDAETQLQDTVNRVAAATVAWQGFTVDGKALDCTEANARTLYGDPRFPWILEQLTKVLDDRTRFFRPASSN